jgi:hypothetical protein
MFHRIAAAAGAVALLLAGPSMAQAASPHEVDPLTMTPALNPSFTWTCFTAGAGITCQGTMDATYSHEQMDLECDGRPVYISGGGREFMTRWHTAEGLATKTIIHLDYPGDHLTLSPDGTGPEVVISGHWNRHYVYPTPGELSTRTLTEVGNVYTVTDGTRRLFQSSGYLRWMPGDDFNAVDVVHGPHEVEADFAAFDAAICDAIS